MSIYLDYAAATPLHPSVLQEMLPYFNEQFYNPSSAYQAARQVRSRLEEARKRVAYWLGAKPTEIIFTAGATEAVNMAVHGVMQRFPQSTILVAATDHAASAVTVQRYNHRAVPVSKGGQLDLTALAALVDDQTVLVSVDYANSEIGVIQPIHEVARLIKAIRQERQQRGSMLPLFLHTDASQAAPYLDLHVSRLGVDLMSLNGGKLYGPKQSGALYARTEVSLTPYFGGGGQEGGRRSGTENVPGIIGFAASLELAQKQRKANAHYIGQLRDELAGLLRRSQSTMRINGDTKSRLPNILHVSWPGIDGERLLILLDEAGVQVATGAACSANKQTASSVLLALGLDEPARQGSIRFSLGTTTTAMEVQQAAGIILHCLKQLQ